MNGLIRRLCAPCTAAAVLIPVLAACGSSGHVALPGLEATPAGIVAPHYTDFHNRRILERSIRGQMIRNEERQDLGGRVSPVSCIDLAPRHWECHVTFYPAGMASFALILDVHVSSDYQRWVSDQR